MSAPVELRRLTTPQDLFQAAAEEVIRAATSAITERGRFTIALSGGSTPKNLYTLIAANASASLPWDHMFFFWGDERHVPPDDPDSNYRMAKETLLSKVAIPPANIFRIPAENPDASAAADAYEQTLRKFFAVAPGEFPRFDLILLGIGPDGHTASLFPETAALAGDIATGGGQLGGEAENQPDYFHAASAERSPLCCVPGEWNGQGSGSARSSGRQRPSREIPLETGAAERGQADLVRRSSGSQRTVNGCVKKPSSRAER